MSTENSREGWRSVRLGDVALRTSKRCTPELSDSVRWVGADHLDEGDLSVRRWSTTDDPMFPPTFCFAVPSGSVLLHSRNPKKVAILPFDAITGEKLFCLSPVDMTTLDSRFLACQLQSDHFHEFVGRWLSGSVNKFLNWTALERYEFALPPLGEQAHIVSTMKVIDSCIDNLSVLDTESVKLALSVFEETVQNLGAKQLPLSTVGTLRRGYSFSSSDYSDDSGYPFMTLASVQRTGGYRADGLKFLKSLPKIDCRVSSGDLLIANTDLTPGREFIGRPVLVPDGLDGAGFSHHLSRLALSDASLCEWLFWELQSRIGRRFVKTISRGSTVIMLDMKRIGEWPVRIPGSCEREAVLRRIRAALSAGNHAAAARQSLLHVRSALLNNSTGESTVVH